MIAKTLTGVRFFDEAYGGVFMGRALLASGKSGAGKSYLGFQFVRQGLDQDERCLILSTQPANDLTICAESIGLSIAAAVDQGQLVLLEYESFLPGRHGAEDIMLPPDGFQQLSEIIEANAIRRVVLDTVLPWVAIRESEHMVEHVFSFVRAFERLGATTLMTLPKPVSAKAFRLKNVMEDVIPICVNLTPAADGQEFTWHVTKYLGRQQMTPPIPYVIKQGVGLDRREENARPPEPQPAPARPAAPARQTPSFQPVVGSPAPPARREKISFSSFMPVDDVASGNEKPGK